MYCKKCGNLLEVGDTVCKNCGEKVQSNSEQQIQMPNVANQNNNINEQGSVDNVNPQPINQDNGFVQQPINSVNPEPINQQESVDNVNPTPINQGNGFVQQPINSVNPEPINQNVNIAQPELNTTNNGSSNKSLFIIIVIILVVLILGLVLVLFKDSIFASKTSNDNTILDTTAVTTTNSNPSPVSNSNVGSYYGFEFPIPAGYTFSVDGDFFQLVNRVDKVVIRNMVHDDYRLNDLKTEQDELKKSLESNGVTVLSTKESKYENINWLLFEVTNGQVNIMEGFADLGDYYLIESAVYNEGSKSIDEIYKTISKMITGATYEGTKNFSKSDESNSTGDIEINEDFINFDESIFEN